jgi:hypothetical protein
LVLHGKIKLLALHEQICQLILPRMNGYVNEEHHHTDNSINRASTSTAAKNSSDKAQGVRLLMAEETRKA